MSESVEPSRQSFALSIDKHDAELIVTRMKVAHSVVRSGRREGDDVLDDPVLFHSIWLKEADAYEHEVTVEPGTFAVKPGDRIDATLLTDGKVIQFISLHNVRTQKSVKVCALSEAVVGVGLAESESVLFGRVTVSVLAGFVVAYMLSLMHMLHSWWDFFAAAAIVGVVSSAVIAFRRNRSMRRWAQAIRGAQSASELRRQPG